MPTSEELDILQIILEVLAFFLILVTALPFFANKHWSFRIWDFPRTQIFVLSVIVLLLNNILIPLGNREVVLTTLMVVVVVIQGASILPYTPFYFKQSKKAKKNENYESIKVMFANVLQPNKQYGKLVKKIKKLDPDFLLLVETDKKWQDGLIELFSMYEYNCSVPQDNTYGMLVFSKLRLNETKVRYLVDENIPSIETVLNTPYGQELKIFCVHPEPPSPTEAENSIPRDKELLILANEVREERIPVLVFGDLNDVAWSDTTSAFQFLSGLKDPRKGRGLYSTYHAKYPFLRWSLDHIFHSWHFKIVKIKKLGYFGSDHFPMFVEFALNPKWEEIREEE
ncbi:MAG: endonuclease/exonuclease/phosphatase family protein [Candidatus Kapaibacteriales bacterium]